MEHNEISFFLRLYLEAMEEALLRTPATIATDPSTAPSILALLAVSADVSILEKVACNPSTPTSVLEQLAEHNEIAVKEAVIDNPATPMDILEMMLRDNDSEVRYALAENHNVPIRIIEPLCMDDNPYVADRAQRTMERIARTGNVVGILRARRTKKHLIEKRIEVEQTVESLIV